MKMMTEIEIGRIEIVGRRRLLHLLPPLLSIFSILISLPMHQRCPQEILSGPAKAEAVIGQISPRPSRRHSHPRQLLNLAVACSTWISPVVVALRAGLHLANRRQAPQAIICSILQVVIVAAPQQTHWWPRRSQMTNLQPCRAALGTFSVNLRHRRLRIYLRKIWGSKAFLVLRQGCQVLSLPARRLSLRVVLSSRCRRKCRAKCLR